MALPTFHLNHKPEKKEALTIGERRELHNILLNILASLTESAPEYLYTHSQVFANDTNATQNSDHDVFTVIIYTDKDDEPEDKVVAKLVIDIDDEEDAITASIEYTDGREAPKPFSEKALYRDDSEEADRPTTVEKTILPLAEYADDFIESILPDDLSLNVDEDERQYLINDYTGEETQLDDLPDVDALEAENKE